MDIRTYLKKRTREVSEKTGIPVRALRTYQYGERYPRVDQAYKLAEATGLTLEQIYWRPGTKP
jgi:transcriptional regulator with XRE-family HTH domain